MSLPVVGEALPKRNLPILQALARFALARFGWRVEGTLPNLAQFVAVGAPHASSWDFYLGMMLIIGLGVRVSWMGKAALFRWPLGGIMRWLGGIAIDRKSRHNVVEQTVQHFATHPQLIVGLMPEGTRKRAGVPVKEWKTGFYYIATGAHVPILPIYIDNPGKRVIFGRLLMPTGDLAADLATLQQFYREKSL
ncbi:MAG: acyltransferase [Caldilinea sp. CFX5]|nr:acyltransferase [Caldilinea sp. CFX5]